MRIKETIITSIILLGIIVFNGCQDTDSGYNIYAGIDGLPESKIYLHEIQAGKIILLDSTISNDDGSFYFKTDLGETKILQLEFPDGSLISVIISPEEMVRINGSYPGITSNYEISGSRESELLRDYTMNTFKNLAKIDSLSKIFKTYKGSDNFQQIRESLSEKYMEIYTDQRNEVRSFIIDKPASLAALVAYNRKFANNELFDNEKDIDLLTKIDSGLSANYPNNIHTKNHRRKLIKLQQYLAEKSIAEQYTAPGMPLPSFSVNDIEGNKVNIESLKGKPLLLYFWASWNGLSRQTNHLLSDMLKEREDINVLSVSFDENENLWEAAVKIDNLDFINASDLKGYSSPLFVLLNLPQNLPYFILTDKNGIIQYRGHDIEALKNELN